MNDKTVREALDLYRSRVSILKKGYAQEKYRIEQIGRSFLGTKTVREVTSVDIATYRDQRLQEVNPVAGKKRQEAAQVADPPTVYTCAAAW